MRTKWIILGLLFAMCVSATTQPLIGLTKEEVKVFVRKNNREFRRDDSVVKQQFNYLKYINGLRTKTWIIYFSDEDICIKTKLVYDYSEYDDVLEYLNSSFEKVGAFNWEYTYEGATFEIILIKEEWYFLIREQLKEQQEQSKNREEPWKQRIS